MSTTIVPKGAGRAAANAKTNKHAQRTPLPSKAIPHARVEQEAAERSAAIRPSAAPVAEGKSPAKGKTFSDAIRLFGWEITPKWGETGLTDHVTVIAKRGAETLFIEWVGGVFQETATYTVGDRTIKMRNASQAKQFASRSPEAGLAELKRVGENRFFRKRETPKAEVDAQRQALPFDPALMTDDEVIGALAGRKLTWFNRLRETPETGVIQPDYRKDFTHITEDPSGERIVNFVDIGTGFRSFRLSALLSVSRGKPVSVKRNEQVMARSAAGARIKRG